MSSQTTSRGSRFFTVVFVVLFVAMAAEILLLVRQNRALKEQISELNSRGPASAWETLPSLEEGERVGPVQLVSLDGEPYAVDYEDPRQETILLIFSPDCPACRQNMDNWKRLEGLQDSSRRLLYVSTAGETETRELVTERMLNAPVLLGDTLALQGYKISYIPTTIVIGPGGVVKRVWVGILPDAALEELT